MRQPNSSQALPNNPVLQVVAVFVAVLIAIAAVFVGAVVLSFFVGFAIIGWLILMIRLWWLRRKVGSGGAKNAEPPPGEIVGVEYTVVQERSVNRRDERDSD